MFETCPLEGFLADYLKIVTKKNQDLFISGVKDHFLTVSKKNALNIKSYI